MTQKQKLWLAGAAIAAFGVGGWFYATPYLTLQQMYGAAKQENPQRLSGYIDFPAVRENLKQDLQATFAQQISGQTGGILGLLGAALGGVILDPVLDTVVSPEGVAALLQGQTIQLDNPRRGATLSQKQAVDVKTRYTSFNEFEVSIAPKENPEAQVNLRLTRSGLSWKLSEIDLPLS